MTDCIFQRRWQQNYPHALMMWRWHGSHWEMGFCVPSPWIWTGLRPQWQWQCVASEARSHPASHRNAFFWDPAILLGWSKSNHIEKPPLQLTRQPRSQLTASIKSPGMWASDVKPPQPLNLPSRGPGHHRAETSRPTLLFPIPDPEDLWV